MAGAVPAPPAAGSERREACRPRQQRGMLIFSCALQHAFRRFELSLIESRFPSHPSSIYCPSTDISPHSPYSDTIDDTAPEIAFADAMPRCPHSYYCPPIRHCFSMPVAIFDRYHMIFRPPHYSSRFRVQRYFSLASSFFPIPSPPPPCHDDSSYSPRQITPPAFASSALLPLLMPSYYLLPFFLLLAYLFDADLPSIHVQLLLLPARMS